MPPDGKTSLRQLLDALDAGADRLDRLLPDRPRDGLFFGTLERAGLSEPEVRLVLTALAARLDGRAELTGADLVGRAARGSADRLELLASLIATRRLASRGLLVPESLPADTAAALETPYRLASHLFRQAGRLFSGETEEARAPLPTGPYASNTETLADLRRLSLLYRQRAARLFHLDPWSGAGLEVTDGAGELLARAEGEERRVRARMQATEPGDRFPLLVLAAQHELDIDALVILVTVLFQELVEGVGAVDAVDLVKLVSRSEADLVRRRALLRPLQRKGLLRLEGAYAGKELTADASLPNGVVEGLLGHAAGIDADEKLDFHGYLEQLDSSDAFFTELDGGEPEA